MGQRSVLRRQVWKRVAGLSLALLVLVVTGQVTAPRASATSGSIQNPQISIVNDGTSEVTEDTSDHDGFLALGNNVIFRWSATLLSLEDGELTQTLPLGLTWNEASLSLAGMTNASGQNGYVSSYVLSDEGRTLTLKVATAPGASGAQHVEFTGISAKADRATAQIGAAYAPTLTVTDGSGTSVVAASGSPSQVTIVGQVRAELSKVGRTTNPGVTGTYDFGSGPVAAIRHTFGIVLSKSVEAGDRNFEWQGPVRVADRFTLTQNGSAVMSSGQAIVLSGTSGGGLTAVLENVDAAAGTFEIVFDSIPKGDDPFFADVSVWIPSTKLPNLNAGQLPTVMANTVTKAAGTDWASTDGAEIVDANRGNNTQIRNYGVQDSVSGSAFYSHDLRSFPARTILNSSGVYTGTQISADDQFRPAGTRDPSGTIWTAVPSTNLNMFEYWDPADTLFKNAGAVYSGNILLVENSDYRVYFSTDRGPGFGGPTNPMTMSWVLQSDYVGDLGDVASLRIEYIGNGGVYQPAPSSQRDTHNLKINPQLEVVRGLPNTSEPSDLGRVVYRGQVIATLQTAPTTNYNQGLTGELWVRAGDASITKTGVALSPSGDPQIPTTEFINAGQSVRYIITPMLKGLKVNPDDSASLVIPDVRVTDCLPANTLTSTLDFSRVDTAIWGITVTPGGCASGSQAAIVFQYLPQAHYADSLAPISFDVQTSKIAPQGNAFDNTAGLQADGIFGTTGGAAASATARMYASQPSVAAYEKFTDTPSALKGEKANYQINWFNFLSSDQGDSYFVDVLPYNGDPRGTVMNGEATLASASITAAPELGATLQLTTDAEIRAQGAADAPAASVTWIDYATATPMEIAQTKALRVHLNNFVAGAASVGSLQMALNTDAAHGGDSLHNTVNGLLDVGTLIPIRLTEAKPVSVDIVASSISGLIWEDTNGNGVRETSEPAIEHVTVKLLSGGSVVATTATDADGKYRFSDLAPGDYVMQVETATLPTTAGSWESSANPAAGVNGVSGTVTLGEGEDLERQDFGFRNKVPGVELEKSGTAPAELKTDEPVSWSFKITNTGNMRLSQIELSDEIAGMSPIVFGSWPTAVEGLLEPGQSILATATSPLTQKQLDAGFVTNEASVTAVASDSTTAVDEASATVALARAASLNLVKSVAGAGSVEPTLAKPGNLLNYGFLVTNDGNVSLSGVEVTDALAGLSAVAFGDWPNPAAPGMLLPGESVSATATLTITQAHLEAGEIVNTATAEGTGPEGDTVQSDGTATVTFAGGMVTTPKETEKPVKTEKPDKPDKQSALPSAKKTTPQRLETTGGPEVWGWLALGGVLVTLGCSLQFRSRRKS